MGNGRRRGGFTLIELLVVVAIIALLISIMLPSLKDAQELARMTACSSNERTLMMGCFMYAQGNNERFPPHASGYNGSNGYTGPYWDYYLSPEIGPVYNPKIFSCPDTLTNNRAVNNSTARSYRYNIAVSGGYHSDDPRTYLVPISQFSSADRLIVFGEDVYLWAYNKVNGWTLRNWGDFVVAHQYMNWVQTPWNPRPESGSANVAFLDGHVAATPCRDGFTYGRVDRLIITPGTDK